MGFSDFLGNQITVGRLRESIAAGRIPQAIILAGPRGVGKYTLALMFAQAANCVDADELHRRTQGQIPDFCGRCSNCVRIAAAAPLESRFDEAIAAREELREADRKETRILIRTHPDVLVIPPDPPQLLIKIGQVRTVIRELYRVPTEARRAFYIFTGAAFMKEAANSLLKALEEPPEFATLVLLAENPGELLPTIRSRAPIFRLGSLPLSEIENLIAQRRPDWNPSQRSLVARLAEGAAGRALSFDLERYLASRQDAITLLRNATGDPDYSSLFRVTESYRAGAEGQEKTSALIRALMILLEDLLLLQAKTPDLVRNVDLRQELQAIAALRDPKWIETSVLSLDRLESGMRRNLIRSLALDALTAEMAG